MTPIPSHPASLGTVRLFESSTLSERKLSDIIKQYAVEISKQPAADRPRMYV